MKRRAFIKGTIAAGIATGTAVVAPNAVAKWSKETFQAKSADDALAALGLKDAEESKDIKIKAPEIAENGNVVPITVDSGIEGTESISLFISKNPTPLTAVYTFGEGAKATVKSRVKMGKSSDIVAVVKAGDKVYKNTVTVKVTKGGCGG
jgi:sulfur-oxidizing protein SoxY